MDRFKLNLIAALTCVTAIASAQIPYDVQWGSSPVGNAFAVKYSSSGDYLLTHNGTELRVWRTSNGALVWVRSIPNLVDATFDASKDEVLAGTTSEITRYSALTGASLGAFSSESNAKGYVAVTPDGQWVAASLDGSFTSIYSNNGTLVTGFATDPGPSTPYVQFIRPNVNAAWQISVGVKAFRLDGTAGVNLRGGAGDSALAGAFSPFGIGKFATLEGSGGTYTHLATLGTNNGALSTNTAVSGLVGTPAALGFGIDRRRQVMAIGGNNGATNGTVTLINYTSGAIQGTVVTSFVGTRKSLAFSPKTDQFALISNVGSGTDYRLELWTMNEARTNATRNWVQGALPTHPVTQMVIGASNASVAGAPILATGTLSPNSGGLVVNGNTGGLVRQLAQNLFEGTRARQLTVSPNGRYLGVVGSGTGNNLRAIDLTNGAILNYTGGNVSGAAFYTNTDMVVSGGPQSVRVGASAISNISYSWGERSTLIDPAVSPDGTRAAMVDTFSNEFVVYNVGATSATPTRYAMGTYHDYGFLSNNDLWTAAVTNTGTTPSATITVYNGTNPGSVKQTRTQSFTLPGGATFGGWSVVPSRNGKWFAFIAPYTDSAGNAQNRVWFFNRTNSANHVMDLRYPSLVRCAVFSADSSMLYFGTNNGTVASLNIPVFVTAVTPPASVFGGNNGKVTIDISEPGRIGGTPVYVTPSAGVSINSPVIVPQGQTKVTATFNTDPTATATAASIQAVTVFGTAVTGNFMINPPSVKQVTASTDTVLGGQEFEVTVSINGVAPAGGYSFAVEGAGPVVPINATETVPAGESSVTFPVNTTVPNRDQAGRVKATGGDGVFKQTPTITVLQPQIANLTVSSPTVAGGGSLIGTVTLAYPSSAGNVTVPVTADNGAVTVGVARVAKNATTGTFTIDTTVVPNDTLVTLTGVSGGQTRQASFTITGIPVTGITLNQSSVKGGNTVTGTLYLAQPAPEGMQVPLTSSHSSIINDVVVDVPTGATSADFTLQSYPTANDTSVSVTASNNGGASANVTVLAPVVTLYRIQPNTITGGNSTTGQIYLDAPAPAGFTFNLSTSSPLSVPATVTFTAGETLATFTINSSPVGAQIKRAVTITRGAFSDAKQVTVNP